jgi:hypothetical protein
MFLATPWILTPSKSKILYARPLEDFWRGLGRSGGANFGMSIVGYSLPSHDHYARQALYSLASNYQGCYWGKKVYGLRKKRLVLVDLKSNRRDCDSLRRNYRFLDFKKTEWHLEGFDMRAVNRIFR